MKRVNTKATSRVEIENGLKVVIWTKTCPICGKQYETSVRHQKFCSDKCAERAQKKKAKQRREYNATKEIARLSSRAHALAVETLNQLVRLGQLERKCACCGAIEGLQVHHKDCHWLNNDPTNLELLCVKCHTDKHKDIVAEYDSKSGSIYSVLLK